jgi:hypothetical protein
MPGFIPWPHGLSPAIQVLCCKNPRGGSPSRRTFKASQSNAARRSRSASTSAGILGEGSCLKRIRRGCPLRKSWRSGRDTSAQIRVVERRQSGPVTPIQRRPSTSGWLRISRRTRRVAPGLIRTSRQNSEGTRKMAFGSAKPVRD